MAVDTITDENWNKWKTESIKQDLLIMNILEVLVIIEEN